MQKLLMTLALSVSAASLVACKDKDPNAERAEKAAENLNEARDEVREAAENVADEKKDIADEAKDIADESKDVAKAQNELAGAQAVADEARGEFVRAAQVMIDSINQRIKAAESRWGMQRKGDVDALRGEVTELEKMRDEAAATTNANWQDTKRRFDEGVKRFDTKYEETRARIEDKK